MTLLHSVIFALALLLGTAGQTFAQEPPAASMPQSETKPRNMEDMHFVVLRTIDKLSARTHTFEIPVDKTVKFGKSLFIKARACRKSSPLDQPENAAFLQIWERKSVEEKAAWVFSGWMFASNPSLSAMDHSVYDVWVIECKNAATSAKSESFSSEKAPEGTPVPSTTAAEAEAEPETKPETAPEAAKAEPEEEPVGVDEEVIETTPSTEEPPAAEKDPKEEVTETPDPAVKPSSPMPKVEELPGSFEDSAED